jgi:hypothetical protein
VKGFTGILQGYEVNLLTVWEVQGALRGETHNDKEDYDEKNRGRRRERRRRIRRTRRGGGRGGGENEDKE